MTIRTNLAAYVNPVSHLLRARLNALYFHLYGVSRDDADYILSTFPIVSREDEAEFDHYRTRELVLATRFSQEALVGVKCM